MPSVRSFSVRLAVFLSTCWSAGAQKGPPPGPIPALLRDGDTAFRDGDYAAARQAFEKALKAAQQLPADSPLRYDVLKRLTSSTAAAGQFAEAHNFLDQPIQLT